MIWLKRIAQLCDDDNTALKVAVARLEGPAQDWLMSLSSSPLSSHDGWRILIEGLNEFYGNPFKHENAIERLAKAMWIPSSKSAANHVLGSLGSVGKTRRVEHANFAVLRTSDVPAMLVETGFISNHSEEALLSSPDYQRRLAAAVLDGISDYFLRQPPPGTLFAARAQATQVSQAPVPSGAVGAGGSP